MFVNRLTSDIDTELIISFENASIGCIWTEKTALSFWSVFSIFWVIDFILNLILFLAAQMKICTKKIQLIYRIPARYSARWYLSINTRQRFAHTRTRTRTSYTDTLNAHSRVTYKIRGSIYFIYVLHVDCGAFGIYFILCLYWYSTVYVSYINNKQIVITVLQYYHI